MCGDHRGTAMAVETDDCESGAEGEKAPAAIEMETVKLTAATDAPVVQAMATEAPTAHMMEVLAISTATEATEMARAAEAMMASLHMRL